MQTIFSIALMILLITCDTPVDPARVEDIVSIINNYDNGPDGNCTFKAGSGLKGCDFLCEDGSFIVICNQNLSPVTGNCSTLGEIVQKMTDQCQGDNSTLLQGEFYDTELNLSVSIGGGLQNCSNSNGTLTP